MEEKQETQKPQEAQKQEESKQQAKPVTPFELPDTGRAEIYKTPRNEIVQNEFSVPEEASVPSADKEETDVKSEEDQGSSVKEPVSEKVSPEEDTGKEEQDDKSEGHRKTVPLAALHAEREKRKEANLAARKIKEEADAKLAEMEARLAQLEDKKQDDQLAKLIEDSDDLNERERLMLGQIQQLKKDQERIKIQADQNNNKASLEARQRRTIEVDKALENEGYPGFVLAGQQIQDAVQKRYNEGLLSHDDLMKEDTYINAFKEEVFPSLDKKFSKRHTKEVLRDKTSKKADAQLIDNSGKAPKKEIKEESTPQTFEEAFNSYLKQRQSQIIE
jgi:hypothetical protein